MFPDDQISHPCYKSFSQIVRKLPSDDLIYGAADQCDPPAGGASKSGPKDAREQPQTSLQVQDDGVGPETSSETGKPWAHGDLSFDKQIQKKSWTQYGELNVNIHD